MCAKSMVGSEGLTPFEKNRERRELLSPRGRGTLGGAQEAKKRGGLSVGKCFQTPRKVYGGGAQLINSKFAGSGGDLKIKK